MSDLLSGDTPSAPIPMSVDAATIRLSTGRGSMPRRTKSTTDGCYRAAPVQSFPPNGHALYEVTGKVWEWHHSRRFGGRV
jgi:formylglycine-generating enzyme required for sulfatase activity